MRLLYMSKWSFFLFLRSLIKAYTKLPWECLFDFIYYPNEYWKPLKEEKKFFPFLFGYEDEFNVKHSGPLWTIKYLTFELLSYILPILTICFWLFSIIKVK